MSKTIRAVLFGRIEFGEFKKGDDLFPCAFVHEVQAKKFMDEDQADDYMVEHHFDGYLIPSLFKGEILFSVGANHA